MCKMVKARGDAISTADEQSYHLGMLGARHNLVWDKLNSLTRKDLTGCETKVGLSRLADAISITNSLVYGLRRGTFDFYASIRHNDDQSSLTVSRRLMEMIDYEAKEFQRGVHVAFCGATSVVQKSFLRPLMLWTET